jgi:hypothetical protein
LEAFSVSPIEGGLLRLLCRVSFVFGCFSCFLRFFFQFPKIKVALTRPGIKLLFRSGNCALRSVHVAMDGQFLALFPALDGSDVALQVSGNLLPRLQEVAGFAILRHGIPIMFS